MQNSQNENLNIPYSPISQLSNLFLEIQDLLSTKQSQSNNLYIPSSSTPNDISSITNMLKKSMVFLIEKKMTEITKKYETQLRKLEQDNRRYIQTIFNQKLQISTMDKRICCLLQMEEEYEEMKIKFKYQEGEFLSNDRKENEIYILRAENSNLKQMLSKLEQENNFREGKIAELKNELSQFESKCSKDTKNSQPNYSNKVLISTSSNTTYINSKKNILNIKRIITNSLNSITKSKSNSKKKKMLIGSKLYHKLVCEVPFIRETPTKINNSNSRTKGQKIPFSQYNKGEEKSLSIQVIKSPSAKNINFTCKNLINNMHIVGNIRDERNTINTSKILKKKNPTTFH